MTLSEELAQVHENGDFGNALQGYAARAERLEMKIIEQQNLITNAQNKINFLSLYFTNSCGKLVVPYSTICLRHFKFVYDALNNSLMPR